MAQALSCSESAQAKIDAFVKDALETHILKVLEAQAKHFYTKCYIKQMIKYLCEQVDLHSRDAIIVARESKWETGWVKWYPPWPANHIAN